MRKTISVKDFREQGYLQELNRVFLHPLGLALAIDVKEDGTETLHEIWDNREDLEGFTFGEGMIDQEKLLVIKTKLITRKAHRVKTLGFDIQPG